MASSVGNTSTLAPHELEQQVMEELKKGTKTKYHCIYRIPTKVRRMNSHAYTPFRVSIGPYHCAKDSLIESPLRLMEPYKLTYLTSLMLRSSSEHTIFKDYMGAIESRVSDAWGCYEELQQLKPGLNLDEFKTMMLLDGAFIVEFFCRSIELAPRRRGACELQPVRNFVSRGKDHVRDPLSDHATKYEVLRDLILLENQLPYFVLESLFELTFRGKERPNQLSFDWIACFCLRYMIPVRRESTMLTMGQLEDRMTNNQVFHLVHLLRICCLHPDQTDLSVRTVIPVLISSVDIPNREPDYEFRCVSATELNLVGVRFEKAKYTSNLFYINFNEANGVIQLPFVIFNDTTETFFRNIMAFEQYYLNQYHISDYMCFMDRIVDTPRDVEILEQNNIISNWLDSKESVSKIINGMNSHTGINFGQYKQISKEITAYATKPWNRYKAMLRRDYFGTPWAIISLIAALLLLALTALQTIATVRSTKW